MSERIVVITGANGGLGSFVTRRFLANGDTVVGASRSIQQSDFPDDRFVAITTDFFDVASVQNLADQTITRFGRIDVVVHVVGGFAGGKPLHETGEQTWSQMLDQNLNAAFHVVRAVIPHMRKAGAGRFIAVGSHAAERPLANLGAYVVSKAALVTLIKTLALENADCGVLANAVLPGTMDTPANRTAMPSADFKKWVPPADVAEVIFWLAGDLAGQLNGAAIPVNGREP
ncbi:MAG TPA: SDR family NAD(P)-dependent oxidoreductase [Terriglobales bacterium]|nr:SDR family NAD(P)-dependent oxidoreductase [Terriglobales bacterium]